MSSHSFKHSSLQCAQVKLVKCLVDNIVVDISFQSLGGLCTVNFLESIDRRIDDHHLFKRSIILVQPLAYNTNRRILSLPKIL